MDLKESMKPIIVYWWVIVLAVALTCGGIYLSNRSARPSWDGVVNVIVQQTIASYETGSDFKYDGYYAVLANQQLSDTLETWLVSPDVVYEIFQRAQLNPPSDLNSLSKVFSINKEVSQSIRVVVNTGSQEEGEKLLSTMLEVMRERVEKTIVSYDNRPIFTVTGTNVLVLPHVADFRLQYGVGTAIGLLIGLLLTYFLYALGEEKSKKKNK